MYSILCGIVVDCSDWTWMKRMNCLDEVGWTGLEWIS